MSFIWLQGPLSQALFGPSVSDEVSSKAVIVIEAFESNCLIHSDILSLTYPFIPLFHYSIISLLHILSPLPFFSFSFPLPLSHAALLSHHTTILLSFAFSLTPYCYQHCHSWSFRRVSQFLQVSPLTGPFGSSTGTRLDIIWCDVMWYDVAWRGPPHHYHCIFDSLLPPRPLTCVQAIHNASHLTPCILPLIQPPPTPHTHTPLLTYTHTPLYPTN